MNTLKSENLETQSPSFPSSEMNLSDFDNLPRHFHTASALNHLVDTFVEKSTMTLSTDVFMGVSSGYTTSMAGSIYSEFPENSLEDNVEELAKRTLTKLPEILASAITLQDPEQSFDHWEKFFEGELSTWLGSNPAPTEEVISA